MKKLALWGILILLFGCGAKNSFDHNALLGLENQEIQVIWSYVDRKPKQRLKQETFLLSQKALQNQKEILAYKSDEAGFSIMPECFISIFSDKKMIKNIPFSSFDSLKKNTHFKKLLKNSQKIEMNFQSIDVEHYPEFASQTENIFYMEERGDKYEVGFFILKE